MCNLEKAMETVLQFFDKHLGKPGEIIGVCREHEGWHVDIEVIEESEYMRKHGRNDLMAIYSVKLNEHCEITCYERKCIRERGKVDFDHHRGG